MEAKEELQKHFGIIEPSKIQIMIWKVAQKELLEEIKELPSMKRGKFEGNKWYKTLILEMEDSL